MSKNSYNVIVEKDGDGFVALCPELEVASQGHTTETAVTNLKEALELLLECADADEIERRTRAGQLAAVLLKLDELKAIASELFCDIRIQVVPDPEIADTYYVVFSVSAEGDPREVANRRREWYRRTDAILQDDCDKIQLLIDIEK